MNEHEARTEQKLKSLSGDSPVNAFKHFLGDRPLGSKNRDLIRRDLETFQSIIGRLQEKDFDSILSTLVEEDVEVLIDYLHRFMQYVGECENPTISSGMMLKFYEKIAKVHGPTIFIKASLRPDTLVSRINSY